jgi:hypothetical protein
MPPFNIPFPLSTAPGAFNQEAAGRLINGYAEPLGKTVMASKGLPTPQIVWRKTPGSSLFAASTHPSFRGGILVGGTVLYTAWSGKVATFTAAGTESVLTGTLTGSEKVFWAHNNQTPADVVCVAPGSGAYLMVAGVVVPYSDEPPGDTDIGVPNSVGFMDGYFIFTYGDGTMRATELNGTDINTLHYTTEQSKPGGLLRGLPYNGQYYVWGPNHGAVYNNTGEPEGFPFRRSYVIQRGLLGRYAVAGHEHGFGSALIWVADDNSVVMASGSPTPTKISPPDLDRLIEDVVDKNTLEASVYISQGHPKWVLSCDTFTWEFDIGTQKWNERASYLVPRWRGISGIAAFGKWVVGDTKGNRLLYVNDDAYDEYLEPLIMVLESGPVVKFPSRTRVARADFNFVVGTGDATGPDPSATVPTVGISWSNDGGFVWSNEFIRRIGRQSDPGNSNLVMLRTGMTRNIGRRWRLRVSGEVYAAFLGGSQDTALRRF